MRGPDCSYCHRNPGIKPNGTWKGFKDADTGQHLCWACQSTHYKWKHSQKEFEGLYSEFPVMTIEPQLTLAL